MNSIAFPWIVSILALAVVAVKLWVILAGTSLVVRRLDSPSGDLLGRWVPDPVHPGPPGRPQPPAENPLSSEVDQTRSPLVLRQSGTTITLTQAGGRPEGYETGPARLHRRLSGGVEVVASAEWADPAVLVLSLEAPGGHRLRRVCRTGPTKGTMEIETLLTGPGTDFDSVDRALYRRG